MRILYLCSRKEYDTKMSRVRFHSMQAISKISEVKWSGAGWDNYDSSRTVQENVEQLYQGQPPPELIVAYKPLRLKAFCDVQAPTCIRYNEMYDHTLTKSEIIESRINLVVCHHRNEFLEYKELFRDYHEHPLAFANIPHCAEKTFYRDYGLPKKYDLLLVGKHNLVLEKWGRFYPLRDRLSGLLNRFPDKYVCRVLEHPGYVLDGADTDRNCYEYARELNSARICLTCSGVPRTRYGKYVEIPMCASALAADLPDEAQDFFRQFVIELDMPYSDKAIVDKLVYYLENENERQLMVQRGSELSSTFTMEYYAERFLEEAGSFLAALPAAGK